MFQKSRFFFETYLKVFSLQSKIYDNMSPQNLPQYLQQYVVFLMHFGKQDFSRTSELNYGCCLFHSKKDLLYGFWGNFARGIQREVPSGQDGSILPVRVANLQRGASHIIILFIVIT